MIRRIQSGEYLKRYDNMTADERSEYESRVGQWLSESSHMLAQKGEVFGARMQNVLQVSGTWNDQECQAFEEGARLLSALVNQTDTWLPDMLYVKSAKRAIRRMFDALWGVDEGNTHQPAAVIPQPPHPGPFQAGTGHGTVGGGNNEGEGKKEDVRGKMDDGTLNPEPLTVNQGMVPVRPKHIDQYIHLLPQKTQEHAALVQGLYRELEEARQKMQLLMDDPKASPADREAWAKKATKCDNTLRKIFDELDAEWAKLVKEGRVVVDDLGNARVMTIDHSEPAELTSEQKARRRDLRKWLVDTRRGNGDTREEYVGKWKEKFGEYLTLDGDKAFGDEKIMEAAKHYGITDFRNPGIPE